ncbi:MAG: acetylserotonin O-methyltransferase, partial [Thermodesulfovibrionales bacterium]|nr:acetylserotonin O-methyltransferase [Thermodesulfovibrionales bacterium]
MKLQDELRELRMLWSAYWPARILLTANNFKIFEYLKKPMTAEELASIIKTDARATEILLDALTSFKLLRKFSKKYQNTSRANRFLTSDSPYYHGNIIKHLDVIWGNWSELDSVIKTGVPIRKYYDHASFIKGMDDISKMKASKVIKMIGLRGVKRALDLGGGPGTYAVEMAKRGVHVTIFDLPETIEIARNIIKRRAVPQDLVDFLAGDVLTDAIGAN